ncbi:MAG: response regulator transcription factor [Solobacterium sp.]|nr:response regulator transcription factor [Solobacterium sp.]
MIVILESVSASESQLARILEESGCTVYCVRSEEELYTMLKKDSERRTEMVFLNSGTNEMQVCHTVRCICQVPLFVLVGEKQKDLLADCLENGADDGLCAPYDTRELTARMHAVLRRCMMEYPRLSTFSIGDNIIDFRNGRVTRDGREVNLTSMEYKLLLILIRHSNTVLTRMEILDILYNDLGEYVNDNTLTVYIKRLRSKIGDEKGTYIRTIRGIGYSLNTNVRKS